MMIHTEQVRIENIMPATEPGEGIRVDILRLDLVHPVISGNKWFKLRNYLSEAKSLQKNKILTWGGPWSNHIAATAAACKELAFDLTILVRGEKPETFSTTLDHVLSLGAELFFIDRENYRGKKIPASIDPQEFYCIPEGGYGEPGAAGAAGIADLCDFQDYTHIICAAGTGTMAAGLLRRTTKHQQLIVIPVLKGYGSLQNEIGSLAGNTEGKLQLLHEYHFGGYARSTQTLFVFMNEFYVKTGIPSDFVYTGKMLFALNDLLEKDIFNPGSRILAIHSGGLQGNESLEKGTLIF